MEKKVVKELRAACELGNTCFASCSQGLAPPLESSVDLLVPLCEILFSWLQAALENLENVMSQ